jgi:hypothetical protein
MYNFSKKCPKYINSHAIGENSPNLVTLIEVSMYVHSYSTYVVRNEYSILLCTGTYLCTYVGICWAVSYGGKAGFVTGLALRHCDNLARIFYIYVFWRNLFMARLMERKLT